MAEHVQVVRCHQVDGLDLIDVSEAPGVNHDAIAKPQ